MSLLNDNHVYSYTQLTTFDECPYGFYLAKIENTPEHPVPLVSNAFSEQGTLIHSLIEEWARGMISKEELPHEYERRYTDVVVTQFPRLLAAKGYTEKSYEQGLEYFQNFNGFDGYEILDVEKFFKTDIDGRPFVGVIDMILQDELTGELIVLDHKSKSLSAFKKAEKVMYRQQYLYSKAVYEQLGAWPDRLAFNLFKENGLMKYQAFDMNEYNETIRWATDTIHKIESFELIDWLTSKEKPDFFCQNLCNVRTTCTVGK